MAAKHKSENTFRDFALALAKANGHPQPEAYVERATAILNGEEEPVEEPGAPAAEGAADGNS